MSSHRFLVLAAVGALALIPFVIWFTRPGPNDCKAHPAVYIGEVIQVAGCAKPVD